MMRPGPKFTTEEGVTGLGSEFVMEDLMHIGKVQRTHLFNHECEERK